MARAMAAAVLSHEPSPFPSSQAESSPFDLDDGMLFPFAHHKRPGVTLAPVPDHFADPALQAQFLAMESTANAAGEA